MYVRPKLTFVIFLCFFFNLPLKVHRNIKTCQKSTESFLRNTKKFIEIPKRFKEVQKVLEKYEKVQVCQITPCNLFIPSQRLYTWDLSLVRIQFNKAGIN